MSIYFLLEKSLTALTNVLYLAPLRVAQYRRAHPGNAVLAYGATKARQLHSEEPVRAGTGWVTSRRALLILTARELVCGSWVIPLPSVSRAVLLRLKTLYGRAYVLKVATSNGWHYQFGLQYDPAWETQTALKVVVEEGRIERTVLSRVVRVVAWALLLIVCILSFAPYILPALR